MTTENNAAPAGMAEALRRIADQDPVELALDPTWAKRIAQAALAAEPKTAEQARPVAYHFHRFVNGEERAEDILIERETSIEAAIKEAVKVCPKRHMTVLVHAPAWVGTLHGGSLAAPKRASDAEAIAAKERQS